MAMTKGEGNIHTYMMTRITTMATTHSIMRTISYHTTHYEGDESGNVKSINMKSIVGISLESK